MTFLTPDEARDHACPIARTSGLDPIRASCQADLCILWRWKAFEVTDPGYMAACAKAMTMPDAATGKPMGQKLAAGYVNTHRAEFGIPEAPYRGWCGLGGKPEV